MFDSPASISREEAHRLLDAVLDADPATSPASALSESIEGGARLCDLVEGRILGVLPAWEASCDWAGGGAASPVAWLVNQTGRPRVACAGTRRTAALASGMAHVLAAARAGALPSQHVSLLVRARTREVAEAFDRDEAQLVATATTLSADGLKRYLAMWRHAALAELGRNEPDRPPDDGTDADTLSIVRSFQGRGVLRGDLTAESLALLVAAIQARIESWRHSGQLAEDPRTYQELVAAALIDLVTDGAGSARATQARPLLIAVATLTALFDRAGVPGSEREAWRAEILGAGPIGRAALRRLMERANVQLLVTDDDGHPLHLGRARRLASAAILIALITRSGGTCEVPGCHATHHRCHAHHLTWWRDGGVTSIDNMALICPHHHRAIHTGRLVMARGPSGPETRHADGTPLRAPPFDQAA